MKNFSLIFLLLVAFVCNAQHNGRKGFNEGWKFRLDSTAIYSDPNLNDAAWRQLDLPHDWSIEGKFDPANPAGTGGGALPGGVGWYRKSFSIPASEKNKNIHIEFDGVYRNSEVFINGHSLGLRPNGYISFSYDLTPFIRYGSERNVIAVKVDNSKQPNSRWYSGSGIYRNVWLTTLNKIHIGQWGTFVTMPVVNEQSASVHINYTISNTSGRTENIKIVNRIFALGASKDSLTFSSNIQVGQGISKHDALTSIKNPRLWSIEKPQLYKLITNLLIENKIVDRYETVFGIRRCEFDTHNGFLLNGKPLKILGVCNHHDLGALGTAINKRALERQLQLLKDMGCNGIRTSHNPPAPELLDLADRMGFIVMDEAFDMWKKGKSQFDYSLDWDQWHQKDLEDFIRRDRNHPSVFIWSVGNEIYEQWGDDSSGRAMARDLVSIVRSLDTTRAITTANNFVSPWNHLILSGAFELIGYNYSHDKWKDFKSDWPGKKLIVTESTSALETRGFYDPVPMDSIRRWPEKWDKPFTGGNPDHTVSAYDHVSTPWGSTHEESVKELKKYDHVSGMYIWTGFDYLGEPTPYGWPSRSSYFGIIDLAGFPKDVYYMYQSEFTGKPVLHIYPHWNWNKGDTVDVVGYYNNADEVELYLNGKSQGKRSKSGDTLHVKWRIAYEPGTLKAVSRKNGKTVLEKQVKTAGEAYRIVLEADRKEIDADGKDLAFIKTTIVDQNGVLVPGANHLVKFIVSGEGFVVAVDNGSPTSLEPFKSNQHTAMNGKALCIIQSNGKKGKIVLHATAEGLKSSTIELTAE
jgi:beta-galactosidase